MSAAPRILVNRRPRTGLLPTVARSLALFVALPVLALFVTAAGVGDGGSGSLAHLVRTVLPGYLLTTAALVIIVLAISLAIGVRCAWLVAAYDFPGRGALSVALVLPLAMPAFVMAYAYTDLLDTTGPVQAALRAWTGWHVRDYWFPDVRSVGGAAVFLALALYPYIYLMARTAFAERPAALEEAGLSLGTSRARLWWQVVLPVARPAIVAGAALVLMETLADFGVVTYFAVDTFTAGIYRAWQGLGDKVAAARLALVLLAFVGVIAWLERAQRGRMGFAVRARRHPGRRKLRGAPAIRATLTCMLAPLLGFVVPALLLVQGWLADGHPVDPRLAQWVFNTLRLASIGAVVTVALGLVAAYAMRTRPGLSTRAAVALASGGYALPGIVLGIGLLLVAGVFDRWVWQPIFGQALLAGSIVALVYAYAVRFFSVAYQGLEAGLQRIGRNMDDSARSLGRSPLGLLREVHWPILRRSLALTGLLVMIDCLKELPATLVLRPFDTDTLAVIAYQFAADERLSQAALPSLMIVVVGVLPVWLLSRTALRG